MRKVAEILRKSVSCHDKHMCQKLRKSRGSCISSVPVLQKVTLNTIKLWWAFIEGDAYTGGGGGLIIPLR